MNYQNITGTKRAKKRIVPAALLSVVLTFFALCGCAVTPGTETPGNTGDVSASATNNPAGETPDAAMTATPDAPPATEISPAPSPTEEPTQAPKPVFPENEYNIGTADKAALEYIAALKAPEKEILTAEQIAAANARMTAGSDSLIDILNIPESIDGNELAALINAPAVPGLPLFDQTGAEISEAELSSILESRNTGAIGEKEPVSAGIIVRRTDLKKVPSYKEFHSAAGTAIDRIQDTELYTGMPVWVMWRSTDGAFVFVRSYYYTGWIKAEDVAAARNAEEWLAFAAPDEFIVITDNKYDIDGGQADMGVKLPYAGIDGDGKNVSALVPLKNGDGSLGTRTVTLPVTSAHIGYLKYTYANFIAQAFKYVGTGYSWGGLNGGVDCSSYVASVLRTFGFYLPRDTKDQNGTAGRGAEISGMSAAEIKELLINLGTDAPVALYTNGHVRFYLGEKDGTVMTIHAPGSNKTVTTARFDNFDSLISIRVIDG